MASYSSSFVVCALSSLVNTLPSLHPSKDVSIIVPKLDLEDRTIDTDAGISHSRSHINWL